VEIEEVWADAGIAEQPATADHAAFMTGLADQRFVLFAGPLAGTEHSRPRVLLIFSAEAEREIHRSLATDPWTIDDRLRITSIEPWSVFVGAEPLASAYATGSAR
jgi:uncharacterized protein YciI